MYRYKVLVCEKNWIREMRSIQEIDSNRLARLEGELPTFRPGDTVRIGYKVTEGTTERIQNFEGVCIGRKRAGINSTFRIRKLSSGEGVERVFPLHSPLIDNITVVKHGRVRRSKLYYLRGRTGKSARIQERRLKVNTEKGS